MKSYTVQSESGKFGENGKPSVGPVYRNTLAKDGFPPPDPLMNTSWDVFSVAAEKYHGNRLLGWREFTNGKAGPYLWKTYQQIYNEVLNAGSALKQLGAKKGSRIGIYGTNCPQWIVAMEACNGYSLICVPLYDTLGPGAVDYIIQHAEIDFVFVQDKKVKNILSPDCNSVQQLKALISFTSVTKEESADAANFGIKAYSWNDFLQMGKGNPSDPLPPQPLDICSIIYTSGTSGTPKGVILTHESHANYVRGVDLYMEQFEDKMTADDIFLSFLPLAHILDRMIEEYFFHKGASIGYYQGDINALREDLMELKPTFFVGVPRVFERVHEGILKALQEQRPTRRMIFNLLYKHKLFWMKSGYTHKTASPFADYLAFGKVNARLGGRVRLMISGGAPLNTEIEEFMRVTTCAYFGQGYGLTETCGLSAIGMPDDLSMLGTVGIPWIYTELRLVEVPEMGYDPFGVPSRGEICIRGKTLFSAYYKEPELTKESIIDGWFHTGDIGEMSPEGVLKIIDRKKNIFKLSQGEYVAGEYLEKVYGFAPIVEDLWVYGDSLKSMLVAVVAPHEDNTKRWAKANGHVGSFAELCLLNELKTYILSELKQIAQKNELRGFEYIRGVVVDPRPFDIERELVTPTMKKRRPQMLKYYQTEINKVYKSLSEEKKK
ncbi:long-chain acyl-CoA synthetase protein [Dioscorea alata]|uniref:Long-chain acyl-CoA synthetase protein n=2 Tax=Dioscorea alata TaxID=55571 RepID=A0ACB7UZZ0_DIOAL|nr:long-chain acyl-CoA synthetase protein [Dioscorea alata]KAH7666588.1 long-chain acyl-CoA synthetase protein [Dioscorea alata]